MLARALLLIVTCLLAAACNGSSATPSHAPSPSAVATLGASGSPDASGPTVDEAFCGTIADLESALQAFEGIKVKPANASKMKDAATDVVAAMTPITNGASTDVLDLADALNTAVDGLSSATENYSGASASGKDAAARKLKKAVTALHTAITQLRQAAVCTPA